MIGWIIAAAAVLFLAVLLVRAAMFKPTDGQRAVQNKVDVDGAHAIESLSEMIKCKTVSSRDKTMVDEGEFEKFRRLLKTRYPNIHKACTLSRIGDTGLLYHWKGKSADEPTVLMAHYDVVPANEEQWDKPAFEGIIEDGVLWGRGTLDTKGTLCGVCESSEKLIAEGFVPEHDIYFSFAGDEEIAGETAPMIVDELERLGVKPALVVDEGGAVVEGVFPGVKEKCALIGIAEKGMADIEFTVKSTGGHASAPPPHGPVGKLAQAVVNVENHPCKGRLTEPIAQMFDILGRRSSFAMRLIFANLWCFMPVLNAICVKSGGELNAMMRTTCAFTCMKGSSAANVLPPEASIVANFRIIGGETIDSSIKYVKDAMKNDEIQVNVIHGMNPSAVSDTKSEGYKKLKTAIEQTWTEAIVSPYLMVACSDSRHFCRISDKVMRFSAMELSKEERGYIHANNERIPTDKIIKTAEFYTRLILQL
ncbi:MAG: M20 family peptidase [Oscillospiraceae bacterium]